MLKFLLIIFVFLYVVFRLGGYIVRILMGNSSSTGNGQTFQRKPRDGNVTINQDPQDKKDQKGYQGGEYVDYEEVD